MAGRLPRVRAFTPWQVLGERFSLSRKRNGVELFPAQPKQPWPKSPFPSTGSARNSFCWKGCRLQEMGPSLPWAHPPRGGQSTFCTGAAQRGSSQAMLWNARTLAQECAGSHSVPEARCSVTFRVGIQEAADSCAHLACREASQRGKRLGNPLGIPEIEPFSLCTVAQLRHLAPRGSFS